MNRGALGWAAADLRRRWPGLVVVALIAGLGAAVVMVAVIGARRTESALPRALAATRTADVELGDTVEMEDQGDVRPVRVVGLVTLYPLDDSALGTDALLAGVDPDEAAPSDETNNIAIGASADTSRDELVSALEPLDGEAITLSAYSFPQTPSELVNASSLQPVPWALATFLVLLGVGAVAHAAHSTLRRRRHDLAVLGATGFRPVDERAAIRWQMACIAAVALVVGVPIGLNGGRLVFEILADDMGLSSAFTTSALLVVVATVGVIVTLQLLGVLLGARAGRQRPATILRTE